MNFIAIHRTFDIEMDKISDPERSMFHERSKIIAEYRLNHSDSSVFLIGIVDSQLLRCLRICTNNILKPLEYVSPYIYIVYQVSIHKYTMLFDNQLAFQIFVSNLSNPFRISKLSDRIYFR